MEFHVIMCGRNHAPWLAEAVNSCKSAGFTNIRYYDDASTDNSVQVATDLGCAVHTSSERLGAYYGRTTLLNELEETAADDDVMVFLDGDDKILRSSVKQELQAAYEGGAWAVYGGSDYDNSVYLSSLPKLMETGWLNRQAWASCQMPHLRTYRYGIWREMRRRDTNEWLGTDDQGKFVNFGCDIALFNPALILAGPDRIVRLETGAHRYRRHSDMCHSHPQINVAIRQDFLLALETLYPEALAYSRSIPANNRQRWIYRNDRLTPA